MTTAVATTMNHATKATAVEAALVTGDLKQLSTEDRLSYYRQVCESVGLNPLTQPFGYLNLNGKLQLYALRACSDQLRSIHHVTIEIISRQIDEGLLVVHARATKPANPSKELPARTDEDYGAVFVGELKGDALANATMKAVTKAKRRVTLSICGMGMLDETEIETIAHAQVEPQQITQKLDSKPPVKKLDEPVQPKPIVERISGFEKKLVALELCSPDALFDYLENTLGPKHGLSIERWPDSLAGVIHVECEKFRQLRKAVVPVTDEQSSRIDDLLLVKGCDFEAARVGAQCGDVTAGSMSRADAEAMLAYLDTLADVEQVTA